MIIHPRQFLRRSFRVSFSRAFAILATAAVVTSARAQAPPQPIVPQGPPIPRILPPQAPPVAPVVPAPPVRPMAPLPNQEVRITRVTVEGVTAYPSGQIDALVAGLVGPATPLARVEAAREAMLQQYRANGYILSAVSANIDPTGGLHFIVTEGRIASVKLAGDIGPAGVQVLRFLNRLTEKRPIDSVTLERYLLLAQDVPGVTLHAVLQPSSDEPGAVTLIAQVSRKPVSGLVAADNAASPYTGPIEGLGVLDFNSFTEFGERTEFSYYHAFPNSENFGQGSIETFVGSSGLKVRVYGGTGPTVPIGPFSQIGYQGTTTVFGGAISYPVIRSRQENLNVYSSFDGIESNITTTSTGVRTQASYDSLRVWRVGADYIRSDILFGADHGAANSVSLRMSKGLPILGASPNDASHPAREGEDNDFFKVTFQLSRTQTLFNVTPTTSVALEGLVTGQWTPDVLPPVEQFYLGGLVFTRGYYSGQVLGDKALAATAELQLNTDFNFTRFGLSENVATQFYLFYDWGETWQNQPLSLNEHISSAGGGMRMQISDRVEIDLLGLARFNRFPTGTGPNISSLYGGAFYWRTLVHF